MICLKPPRFATAEPLGTRRGLRQVREAKPCSVIIFNVTVSAVYTMPGLPGLGSPDKWVSALVETRTRRKPCVQSQVGWMKANSNWRGATMPFLGPLNPQLAPGAISSPGDQAEARSRLLVLTPLPLTISVLLGNQCPLLASGSLLCYGGNTPCTASLMACCGI